MPHRKQPSLRRDYGKKRFQTLLWMEFLEPRNLMAVDLSWTHTQYPLPSPETSNSSTTSGFFCVAFRPDDAPSQFDESSEAQSIASPFLPEGEGDFEDESTPSDDSGAPSDDDSDVGDEPGEDDSEEGPEDEDEAEDPEDLDNEEGPQGPLPGGGNSGGSSSEPPSSDDPSGDNSGSESPEDLPTPGDHPTEDSNPNDPSDDPNSDSDPDSGSQGGGSDSPDDEGGPGSNEEPNDDDLGDPDGDPDGGSDQPGDEPDDSLPDEDPSNDSPQDDTDDTIDDDADVDDGEIDENLDDETEEDTDPEEDTDSDSDSSSSEDEESDEDNAPTGSNAPGGGLHDEFGYELIENPYDFESDIAIAVDDHYFANYETTLYVNARGFLTNDKFQYLIADVVVRKQPEHGTLHYDSTGAFQYTPEAGYSGKDRFEYHLYTKGFGGRESSAVVSIDIAPGTNPYLRAVADRFSFKANSNEVVEIPAKGLLQNDVLPSLGAYDRFQIGIVDAPLDIELSIKKDGSFSFLPPPSPFSFTYSLTYNENKVSYARVKMIPFELQLQLDSPSNMVPLDGDDDNKNDRPDYEDDEERSSPDDDWVRLRVDTNLTSDQEVLIRSRPEHVRLWHRDEDTGQYVLLEGRTPVRNLASVYLQGKALHSEEILVFGSIADEWEEVVGASPKIHVSVVSHEMVVPTAITVDEALQEGVRGTILFRGNSEVDWEAFSRSFPSRVSIYDGNEAKLATLPLEISEWGIAEFQFMIPPSQLYHPNLFGAQRFRFELEYGQQTHRTVSETIVLPGVAKRVRLGGQVLQYLGDNVARQVDQFLLLDEIYHQPTRSPNFATFVDPSYFVSLYLSAADQAGNVLYGSPYRSIPVGLEWNGMTDNRAKSIVKHFDSPTSKDDEIGVYGGAVLVNMLPAASLPLVSQVKVSVDGTSRTVPFSGGSLQIGWDQSNPSEILFDQPSTIRLRIFAPHAPEGAVVEWADSKGFLGDTTTSTVHNGVSSIDFALPFYGLSASLNALGPVYVQARIAGYEASGVVNVRHSLPLRYLLNVTGQILGADIDGTVTPTTQISLPTTATVNTGNEWNDLNVAVAAPTLMHSVAAKQSIKIRGLEPSRSYRAKITGDSDGLFLLQGGLSSERSENGVLYFTPDARLEDVQIDIVSKGAFPDYRRGSFTAVRVEVEEEVAFRAYEAYADASFPSPPTLVAEAVWAIDEAAGFPRMRMLFDSLFQNNPFVNVDLLMAAVQRMRSDIYAGSIAPIRSYEYYTPVGLPSASSPSGTGTPLTMSFDFIGTSALTAAKLGQLQGVSREVFYGALAGSDQLDMAFVGDLGLSAIPIVGAWSDIRDIGKNVARLAPVDLELGPFDWRETTIASVGLIGEVLPPADWLVDSFRILYRVAKVSVKAMPFFLAVEPLFTDAFVKILLHQTQGNSGSVPASSGSTGFGLQHPFNASALRGFLSENGIAHVEELVSLVELILTCVGNTDLRRIVIRTTICSPNAAAAKSLVHLLRQFSVPQVGTILRQIAPTTDEFDTRILHRALDTYSQISRSKGDLRKALQQLSAEETGEVLRRFGRVLATDVSYTIIPRDTGLGVHLLIRLLKEMEAQSFLKGGNAVTNLRNLAEDLETIALGVERGLSNQEELVWVMHKLGVNHGSGTQNGMYGALYELSGMADIMRRMPPGAIAQLELTRWVSWDALVGKEIWTDQDVVDKLSGTVYEMKTSLAAAKKKISSDSCLPNADSIAGLEYSGLFYKMLIHLNSSKDTGFTVVVGDLQGQSIMQTTRDLKNDISQCAKQFGLQGDQINKMLSLISIRHLPVRYKM